MPTAAGQFQLSDTSVHIKFNGLLNTMQSDHDHGFLDQALHPPADVNGGSKVLNRDGNLQLSTSRFSRSRLFTAAWHGRYETIARCTGTRQACFTQETQASLVKGIVAKHHLQQAEGTTNGHPQSETLSLIVCSWRTSLRTAHPPFAGDFETQRWPTMHCWLRGTPGQHMITAPPSRSRTPILGNYFLPDHTAI